MKKLAALGSVALLAAASALTTGAGIPTQAHAASNTSQWCFSVNNYYPFLNHGGCTSGFNTPADVYPAAQNADFCQSITYPSPVYVWDGSVWAFVGTVTNEGNCVSALVAYDNSTR